MNITAGTGAAGLSPFSSKPGIGALPDALLGEVFYRLTPRQRAADAAAVCREWRALAQPSICHRVAGSLRGIDGPAAVLAVLRRYGPALAQLRHLDLRGRQLGDHGARQISALLTERAPGLRFLDLSANGISGAGAAACRLPAGLLSLNLAANALAGERPLALPPRLQALNLSCNAQLDGTYLQGQHWPATLVFLALAGCRVRSWQPPASVLHLDVCGNGEATLQGQAPGRAVHLDSRGTAALLQGWPSRHAAHPLPELERLLVCPLVDEPRVERRARLAAAGGAAMGALCGIGLSYSVGFVLLSPIVVGAILGGVYAFGLLEAVDKLHNAESVKRSKAGGAPWLQEAPQVRPIAARARRRHLEACLCAAIGGVAGFAATVGALAAAVGIGLAAGMTLGAVADAFGLAAFYALGGGTAGTAAYILVAAAVAITGLRGYDAALRWAQRQVTAALQPAAELLVAGTAQAVRAMAARIEPPRPERFEPATWRC